MRVRPWIHRWAIPVLCCGLAGCQRSGNGAAVEPPAPQTPLQSTSAGFFTGTASCSGRSCHGGLDSTPLKQISQNEYTEWLTHDKHADAFRVLFDKRSEDIARNLGGANKAHEDARCLSCHVTPYAASARADHALAETVFGVGCESCHGAAGKWLGPHTGEKWQGLSANQKKTEGMIPVRSISDLAQACVGCHVGSPPDNNRQLPLRDVNHDLIAAGHPRLNFELDVFLDNLPAHWNQKEKEKRDGKDVHGGIWAHGQLASAQAALELLAHRADHHTAPWPEFAEYDCFACHHDLQGDGWRQKSDYGAGRRLGSLPWGTWYFTMPRLLGAGLSPPDKSLRASLSALEQSMGRAMPNRAEVAKQARQALDVLSKSRDANAARFGDAQAVRKWLTAVNQDNWLVDNPSWDAAMQVFLAMDSLDPASRQPLRNFGKKLAFPSDFDSPRDFSRDRFQELLKRLAGGETP